MARPASPKGDKCPECDNDTLVPSAAFRYNICGSCGYKEAIDQPHPMTKWDIIDLFKNDEDVRKAILDYVIELCRTDEDVRKAIVGAIDDLTKEAARDLAWS